MFLAYKQRKDSHYQVVTGQGEEKALGYFVLALVKKPTIMGKQVEAQLVILWLEYCSRKHRKMVKSSEGIFEAPKKCFIRAELKVVIEE